MNGIPTPLDLPNALLVEIDTTGPVDIEVVANSIHTHLLDR